MTKGKRTGLLLVGGIMAVTVGIPMLFVLGAVLSGKRE